MKKILFILFTIIMCIGCSEQSTANTHYHNIEELTYENGISLYCIEGYMFVTYRSSSIIQFFETTINGEVRPKLCY